MSIDDVSIIIAKAPGKLRDGLYSLIENQPFIHLIGVIEDEGALFKLIKQFTRPCIILLDMNLFEKNSFSIYRQIVKEVPQTGCIILVNTFSQKKQAFLAGFNHVLIKGFNTDDLFSMIQNMHSEKTRPAEEVNNYIYSNKDMGIQI